MRLRIRGPAGQSTVTLEDSATVESLKKTIASETSLSSFDIKYGYPPKTLSLDQYSPTQKLTDLDVKLNGEQLIVSNREPIASKSSEASSSQPIKSQSGSSSTTGGLSKASNPSTASRRDPDAPLSLTRKQNADMSDPPEIFIPEVGGTLVLRIMPDDNSCLFRAISSAVMSDMDAVTELRSIVAESIQADPETYNRAILDNKTPDAYCRWIKTSSSWGGQVELLILSQYFQTEICSIDVQTLRVDRYNEGAPRRCFVVYSGIHYDTIALSLPGMTPEEDVKVFESPIREEILPRAVELCRKLQERHYYTDTAGFTVMCNDCGALCTGETGATEHAKQTGHYNFGEAS